MSDSLPEDIRVPVFSPSRKWGINLSGCGPTLEDIVRQSVAKCPVDQCYVLIEIGSASCVSLKAFRDIVSETRGDAPWRVIGFDLPVGKAWSLDVKQAEANGVDAIILNPLAHFPEQNEMSLVLIDDPRQYIRDHFPLPINLVFIDGCHGKCVGLDFLALENKVVEKGVVVFHDYGEAETGMDWQAHCREFINVRTYVHRLGLAEPCNEKRKGWRFVGEIPGTRRWGGDGNSAAVVQRTSEPLEEQPNLSLD